MVRPNLNSFSSRLLYLACSLTSVRASTIDQLPDSNAPRTIRVPAFAFYVIFAILTFGQLTLIGSSGLLREGRLNERALRRGRRICGYLMVLSTVSFIVKYTIGVNTLSSSAPNPFPFLAAYILVGELAEEFLFAALFALLASRVMASDRWRAQVPDGTTNPLRLRRSMDGFNVYFVAVLLASMVLCTIARSVVVGTSNHAHGLAQFILYQVHISIYFVLAIYFTVLAVAMWKKKDSLAFQPIGSAEVRRTVSAALRRTVVYVCPMLSIATAYSVIADVIQSVGAGNPGIFGLLDLVIEGLIYFLLILAILAASSTSV